MSKSALLVYDVVASYGVKNDGTDYSSAPKNAARAMNAINDAVTAGGGTVFFPAGTYLIGAGMTIAGSNITVCGEGPATVINAQFSGASIDQVFYCDTQTDVIIRDLGIEGAHSGGVRINNSTGCRVLRATVSGATRVNAQGFCAGIFVSVVDDLVIDGCSLSGNGSSSGEGHCDICANDGAEQILHSQITNNRCLSTVVNSNICLFNPRAVLVSGNECSGAIESPISNTREGYGILLYHTVGISGTLVGECRVISNYVHDVRGAAIYLQDIRDSIVTDNVVRDVCAGQSANSLSVAGIVIEGFGYVCSNNRVYNSWKDGISISACSQSSVIGNVVSGVPTTTGGTVNGIGIRGECFDVVISGNEITNVVISGIGMWSDTASTRILIANNIVRELILPNSTLGIYATSATSAWTVVNNDVGRTGGSGGYGYRMLSSTSTHTFAGNKEDGFPVTEGFSPNRGNISSLTLATLDRIEQFFGSTLTVNCAVTLPATDILRNGRFRIVRNAGATPGSAELNVGGLAKIAANTNGFIEVEYDATAGGWRLAAQGVLFPL